MSDTLYVGSNGSGGSGSGISISNNHFFADNAARDACFTANPTEKKTGTFISVGAGYEQWNGTAWVDKTAVVKGATGANGADGTDGVDGREVEFQKGTTHIQWRYVGDTTWTNLILITDLKGDTGAQGVKGDKGDTGATGGAIAVDYNVTNAYTKGTLVNYSDGLVYKANDDIPANTVWKIGTTGATWKVVGSGGSGTVAFSDITNKPTTVAGYGITDSVTLTGTETLSNKTFASPIVTGNINTPSYLMDIRSSSGDTAFKNTGGTQVGLIGSGGISVGGYEKNSYAQFNGTTAAVQLKFANNATGKTATDGLNVGVLSDGMAEIRQMENLPLNIYTNNTLLATFNPNGTTSNLSGTWTTISDARLKKDISDISNPIEKVESIAKCVKHYNFINQDKYAKGKRTGYIAQLLAENGLEGHVTQRMPNDEEEGVLFGWTYKDEKYEDVEKEFILNENNEQIVKENVVTKTRRVVDKEGEMILGIENNFTPYIFPAFVAILERVKTLEKIIFNGSV